MREENHGEQLKTLPYLLCNLSSIPLNTWNKKRRQSHAIHQIVSISGKHQWTPLAWLIMGGLFAEKRVEGLGEQVGLSIIFLFALQEMLRKMCWCTNLCQPPGVRWEQARGRKKDKHESSLGLFGTYLSLSESLEQQSKPGPLASALCLCVCQYEFCFNYLC